MHRHEFGGQLLGRRVHCSIFFRVEPLNAGAEPLVLFFARYHVKVCVHPLAPRVSMNAWRGFWGTSRCEI